jgi:hypothetical protein
MVRHSWLPETLINWVGVIIVAPCSSLPPLSGITISLYVKRTMQTDIFISRQEIICEARRGSSIPSNSLNAAATSPSPTMTTLDNRGDEGDGACPSDLPTRSNIPAGPVQDGHTEISHTVDCAEEAVKDMDTMMAQEGAIGVIKQVLDTIGLSRCMSHRFFTSVALMSLAS